MFVHAWTTRDDAIATWPVADELLWSRLWRFCGSSSNYFLFNLFELIWVSATMPASLSSHACRRLINVKVQSVFWRGDAMIIRLCGLWVSHLGASQKIYLPMVRFNFVLLWNVSLQTNSLSNCWCRQCRGGQSYPYLGAELFLGDDYSTLEPKHQFHDFRLRVFILFFDWAHPCEGISIA